MKTTIHYKSTVSVPVEGADWFHASETARTMGGKRDVAEYLAGGGLEALEKLAVDLELGFRHDFFDRYRVQRDRMNYLIELIAAGALVKRVAGDVRNGGGYWLNVGLAEDFARWIDTDRVHRPFAAWMAGNLPAVIDKHVAAMIAQRAEADRDLTEGFGQILDAETMKAARETDADMRKSGASLEQRNKALAARVAAYRAGGDAA